MAKPNQTYAVEMLKIDRLIKRKDAAEGWESPEVARLTKEVRFDLWVCAHNHGAALEHAKGNLAKSTEALAKAKGPS